MTERLGGAVGFDMEQRLAVLQPHLFEGVPLPAVARQAGVPLRTARRWVAAYRAGGADGLTRATRTDRNTRRIPSQVVEVVEGLALRRPPPRIAEVHRAVEVFAAAQGWPTPSYQSVRRIIQGLDRGLLAMAHHDPDVWDWLPRMPESLEELDLLLLTVATPRKVQRDGIHCHGLRYFSITLAAYVGEPVTVRYDPRDLAEIRVYHHDEFLCRAVSPEIATVTVSMQDLQAARNQRRRELRQQLTARRSLVELLTQPSEVDRRRHRHRQREHARPPAQVDPAPGSSCTARTDPPTHGEEHRWPSTSHRRPG